MKRTNKKSNGTKTPTSKSNGRAGARTQLGAARKTKAPKAEPEVVIQSAILIEELPPSAPVPAGQTEILTLPDPVESLDERAAAMRGILSPSRQVSDPDLAPFPTHAADAHDRLARYINEAWSVEKTLVDALQEMADEVPDTDLQEILQEHRAVTDRQRVNLGERLARLGREPASSKGVFNQIISWLRDVLRSKPKDDGDRMLQHVMKGYAIEHLEIAMYEAIFTCAQMVNDEPLAELAAQHLQEEREAADKLRPFIHSAARWAMSRPDSEN